MHHLCQCILPPTCSVVHEFVNNSPAPRPVPQAGALRLAKCPSRTLPVTAGHRSGQMSTTTRLQHGHSMGWPHRLTNLAPQLCNSCRIGLSAWAGAGMVGNRGLGTVFVKAHPQDCTMFASNKERAASCRLAGAKCSRYFFSSPASGH